MQTTEQLEHSLPFAAILAELKAIKSAEFPLAVRAALVRKSAWSHFDRLQPDQARRAADRLLYMALRRQQTAYEKLRATKQAIDLRKCGDPDPAALDLVKLEEDCWAADQPLKRLLYRLRGNALAFSGGGIRSASFCLGVLQGLARFSCSSCTPGSPVRQSHEVGLLDDLQYLSTVSGGGYVGSWLSAWIYRRAKTTAAQTNASCQSTFRAAYQEIVSMLAGGGKQTSGDPSPESVRHLRQFTSYLAPQLGFSVDLWALGAIVLRNLLVNWMMLLPVLMAMLVLPLLTAYLMQQNSTWSLPLHPMLFYPLLGVLMFLTAISSGLSLPTYMAGDKTPFPPGRRLRLGKVVTAFVVPIALSCWLLSLRFYPGHAGEFSSLRAAALCGVAAVGFGTLSLLRWFTLRARYEQHLAMPFAGRRGLWIVAGLMLAVTVFCSLSIGIGAEVLGTMLLPRLPVLRPAIAGPSVDFATYIIFAFPSFLTVLLLGSTLFSALADKFESEEDREWWSRAGGLLMILGFLWISGTALALFSSNLNSSRLLRWLPVNGLALGGITSWLAKSSKTSAGTRPEKDALQSPVTGFLAKHNLLLPALSLLSLTLIAVGLTRGAERLRTFLWDADSPVASCIVLLAALTLVSIVVNWIININIFSLHGMYRLRLARAFLGASNQNRTPDPFTNFDRTDSPHMVDLPSTPGVPLHIVSTTLNLVGTKRAEWRQRKAESFTFSAVSAGSWRLNYVDAATYGGSRGVTLATAMAISGAAANPNMGYHSSPLVTLLMTLFNVRLGWWLPNPSIPVKKKLSASRAQSYLRQSGPVSGVLPLLEELFGKTDDDGRWIELSDGGHFENLGIYEMVLRRCANIVVVDAGADAEFRFEDLGNALRKIEIDLGIPIRFKGPLHMNPAGSEAFKDNRYCAVADIDYSCVDGGCSMDPEYAEPVSEGTLAGKLIYIKACRTGREPMDVTEYANSHAAFPHEPTTNQFFNEAQFESYRHLGSSVVEEIASNTKGTGWASWIAAAEAHAGIAAQKPHLQQAQFVYMLRGSRAVDRSRSH